MAQMIRLSAAAALIISLSAQITIAQTSSEIWKSFAEQVEVGTELDVRLNDGRHFKATLVGIRDSAMLMQPRTRVSVPIQAVPYGDVLRMERTKAGIGAGKAIAIGAATGAGAFFGILAIMLSIVSD